MEVLEFIIVKAEFSWRQGRLVFEAAVLMLRGTTNVYLDIQLVKQALGLLYFLGWSPGMHNFVGRKYLGLDILIEQKYDTRKIQMKSYMNPKPVRVHIKIQPLSTKEGGICLDK